jgi:hypothetical protein
MTAHNHKIKSALALALAAVAVAPAAASAKPLPADPPGWPASTPTIQLVQAPPSSGFDWGDAGIGAAGGLGLTMLAMGGVVVARRRGRHVHGTTSATG